jgi:hypothetical protein
MLSNKDLTDLLTGAASDANRLAEYRMFTTAARVPLSPDMAASLGAISGERRLVPFLDTVVEAITEKLFVQTVTAEKVKDSKAIADWLSDEAWALAERDLYRAVVRDGVAYLLVRWSESGPLYDVRTAYDGESGAGAVREQGDIAFTFNAWVDGDVSYVDCYFANRIEKYIRRAEDKWEPRQDAPDEEWPIAWLDSDGAPLGLALVEYRVDGSAVEPAVQVARDLNEAVIDLVATSRLQGWPQRYLKGKRSISMLTTPEGQPLLSSTGRPIHRRVELKPGSVMLLDQETDIGQLAGATPNSEAIDKLLALLSWITAVPTHFFTGSWPSGVALLNSEQRLNHKVEGHQGRLSSAVAETVRLTMRLSNTFAGTAFNAMQRITVTWYPPQIESVEVVQERHKATADVVDKLFAAGLLSLDEAVKTLHPDWTKERLEEELARLRRAQPVMAEQVVAEAEGTPA